MKRTIVSKFLYLALFCSVVLPGFAQDGGQAYIKLAIYKTPPKGELSNVPPADLRVALRTGETALCVANGNEFQTNGTSRCIVTSRSPDITGEVRISRITDESVKVTHKENVAILKNDGLTPAHAKLGELSVVGVGVRIN